MRAGEYSNKVRHLDSENDETSYVQVDMSKIDMEDLVEIDSDKEKEFQELYKFS